MNRPSVLLLLVSCSLCLAEESPLNSSKSTAVTADPVTGSVSADSVRTATAHARPEPEDVPDKKEMELSEPDRILSSQWLERVSGNLRRENSKVHVTRYAQDRTRYRQKKGSISIRKELKRLKKFLERKLNEYADSERENNQISRQSEDEIRTRLQGFVASLLKLRSATSSSEMDTVVSKIQSALGKNETDDTGKLSGLKESLEALHDTLNGMKLIDFEEKMGQDSKRSKRDLLAEIEQSLNSKGNGFVGKQFWYDNVKGRRDGEIKRREDVGKVVRPSLAKLDSDSGENTFYGFFKTEPVEGFPEGDVFFATGSALNGDENSRKKISEIDYDAGTWLQDDYPFYEPLQLFGKSLNDRMGNPRSSELWEVQNYDSKLPRKSNDFGNGKEFQVVMESNEKFQNDDSTLNNYHDSRVPKNHRSTYSTLNPEEAKLALVRQLPGYLSSIFRGSNFETDYSGSHKFKREATNLHAVLDQEMINEDDANSKDCDCRVIRNSNCKPKREAIESMESTIDMETIPSKNKGVLNLSKDMGHAEIHEDPDVEVFADLRDSSMEKFKIQPKFSDHEMSQSGPFRDYPEMFSTIVPSTLTSTELEDLNQPKSLVRRGESQFFRESRKDGEENTSVDTAERASSGQKNIKPFVNEKTLEKKSKTTKTVSSTTFKTLSEEAIRKESEKNYDHSYATEGNPKRQTKIQLALQEPQEVTEAQLSNVGQNKRRTKARPRESQAAKRIRALKALRDLFREFRQNRPRPTQLGAKSVGKISSNPSEQTRKIKEKRRPIKQRDDQERLNDEEDQENRNLKRREVWEMIKNNDEFDREKLLLLYEPQNNESIEKVQEVPTTEVLRTKNVRQRTFNPSQRKNFDGTIMEHPNPDELRNKIVELANLYQSQVTEKEKLDATKNKSYYALVEDIKKPRIFHYQQKPENVEKRSLQARRTLFHDIGYERLRRWPRVRAVEYSSEEESNEDKELLAESMYPRTDSRNYEIIWEPYSYRPYRIVRQRKREDEVGDSRDLSRYTGELLKILIDNLDSQTAEELYRRLTGYNVVEDKKQNSMRSISKNTEEQFDEAKEVGGFSENFRNNSTDMLDTGNYGNDSAKEETQTQDDVREDSQEVARIRKRGNTGSGEEYFKLPEDTHNRLYLKENSEETSDKSSSINISNKEIPVEKTRDETGLFMKSEDIHEYAESNPIVGTRNPYGELSEDYVESDSTGRGSETSGDVSNVQVLYNSRAEGSERSNETANSKEAPFPNKPEVLMVLPWARRYSRLRRGAEDQEKISENGNAEKVQPRELQQLDEFSSTSTPVTDPIDDVEKSLIQKIPLEKFKAKDDINKKKNVRKNKKDEDGLPSLIERSIPKLESVLVDGLKKAENLTGSMKHLIENLDENYNKTIKREQPKSTAKSIDAVPNTFKRAIKSVKKFFMLLSGVTHLLRG
ncbi:uncharacterized protein LOC108630521 [Ceratina calcarata]|uniref:Uncharacterized protein LOC108630521 n=1 Tax=Ceratina calcarata TaxID=156304 RepID=A0AAJ7SBM6_9HYME|nr:uncharacterized protein LOC108630521 [Ceratina calcarata]